MIEHTHVVPYGRPSSEALARAIGDVQCDDALAPVTVVVPSNFVGLSARRLIGSGVVTAGERVGLANVSFVTPFQLAERVASDLLLDTRPITNPVLGAAVRRALAEHEGPYTPVAEHEATEAALAGLFAELSNVDDMGLEAMLDESSAAAQLAIGFYRSIAAHLDGFHTEHDLALAAAERPDLGERVVALGHTIWFLPEPVTPALGQFLNRVLATAPSTVIVGLSGHADADEPVWRACEAAGVSRPAVSASSTDIAPPVGDTIVSVTDPAEEVRETCSRVIGLLEAGVSPERIAVFVATPDPYTRIIEQQFDAAGIAINGPDPRRLADSVAGRVLLGALELPQVRWRRDRVMALVSSGPVRVGDERARPTSWDELSRHAGVVANLTDWATKLDRYRTATQHQLDALDITTDPEGRRRARLDHRLGDIAQLNRFVDDVAQATSQVASAASWPEKCAAARDLLRMLLGPEHQHSAWPDAEQEAFGRVEQALGRLAALDEIEPTPSPAVFLRALRGELDVARGRRGRFGHGVMFGPLASAVGHDLEAVFVLGAAEGALPAPRRDDAILPDHIRVRSLDQLEPKAARLHHQHRAYLAALAAAPAGTRTLFFPRGSLRSGRRALPSRWLLDTASALAGEPVHATDFDDLPCDVVQSIGSFASGIVGDGASTSIEERDVAAFDRTADPRSHPLASLVGAGIDMQIERSSSRFTVFDGNLAGVDTSIGSRPMSPSRLEAWAACGFRYFLKYVLDVSDRDDPERTDDISALDRGSLIHATLERFIGEAIERGAPEPTTPWTAADRARIHVIADEVAQDYEATGRTGRAIHWRVRRDDLRDLLDRFIDVDDRFRSSFGATPSHVELDLGVQGGRPVEVALPNGRQINMRGLADRVDITSNGDAIVSDYKSGKGKKYDKLTVDPFSAGTTLQLGMYAEGAMVATGATSATADYWLVEAAGKVRRGYHWTDGLRERFHEVLTAIVDGIEDGVFVAAPGEWNTYRQTNEECTYCDFDDVCVRGRGEHALAKADAAEVQVRTRLLPPEDTAS